MSVLFLGVSIATRSLSNLGRFFLTGLLVAVTVGLVVRFLLVLLVVLLVALLFTAIIILLGFVMVKLGVLIVRTLAVATS